MATNKIPGNIIGIQLGDNWLQCQADATLNMTANTSEDALCKELETEGEDAPWKTHTVDSREWNVDVSQALLKDSLATLNNDVNLGKLFIDGDLEITSLLFRTKVDQQFADNDMIYEGAAILTNFSITAPATGANTTSATFLGNGALTYSFPPKTT